MKPVLEVKNVSKQFYQMKKESVFVIIKNILKRKKNKPVEVLHDINLQLYKGEILGLIGSNGSGKSTLIRLIASIYELQKGTINHTRKITSIIGLETGMKRSISVRENIYLIAALYGLSIKEIKKEFNSIITFCELEKYLDIPFYQLSSGMKQKLAFSIATHSHPQILLLDEVFSVGDIAFREKSIKRLKQLVKKGLSIILISHELHLIEEHCDRVILLDKGKIINSGKPKDVVRKYKQLKQNKRTK